jgi:ABC-type phosphate transport system permease subunit
MPDAASLAVAPARSGRQPARSRNYGDTIFRAAATGSAFFVLFSLGAIAVLMLYGGLPAFSKFGFGFLYRTTWDPVRQDFGAAVPMFGTLVTSAIAMLIAVPISFGIAIFLTEVCPGLLRGPIATAVELLAGIPSIIYGMWGPGEVLCRMHNSLHHGMVCAHFCGWRCIGADCGAKLGLQRTVAYVSPGRRDSLPRPDLGVSQTAADG